MSADEQRRESVDPAIRANVEERAALLHRQLLRMAAWIMGLLGAPYYAWHVYRQSRAGELNFATINVGVGLAVIIAGASGSRFPLFVRRWLVVLGITAVSVASVFQDGTTLGVGLIFATSVLVSATLFGPKAAYAVSALLCGLMVWFTLQAYEVIPALLPTAFYLAPESWERSAFTAIICLFALTQIFSFVVDQLLHLLSKETVMRVRERQMEADRAQVLSSAAAIQRLESLGRLAGGVAHDFNNALVVIQCGVAELRAQLGAEGPKDVLDDLNRGIERAASTAKQLLSFARRNVEEFGACNPRQVVESLVRDAERILPAHVRLEPDLEEVGEIAMAASSLEQVLLNLIFNSRDALPEGGLITIALRAHDELGGASLEIRDNGMGMDPATKAKAFDPFFTTKGEKGTGLGLAMVWGALNRVGGSVELRSERGAGTAVTLFVPFADPASSSAIRINIAEVARPVTRPRILLVEDEAQVQRAIERILSQGGYEVVSASRVAEARLALERQNFELLITDGIVPDGGVGELLEEFQLKTWGAPIIVCSGYVEEELAVSGISSGRFSFLPKPFAPDELLEAVREQFARQERREARARGASS